MSERPHVSVLLAEVVEALAPRPGGRYVDLTLGAGGHAEAVLEASSPDGLLLGFDRDPVARALASERLARFGARFEAVPARFALVAEELEARGWAGRVDGLVLDAGVSSMQFDTPERGFSFRYDAPLDMRMGDDGPTAAELLDRWDERQLTDVLRRLGEVQKARLVARRMVEARRAGALATTGQLADLCADVLRGPPGRPQRIHPATQVFQALRMAVNDELGELERALAAIPALLAPGGVAAVISFHSLEDRMVKRAFRAASVSALPRGLPVRASELVMDFETLADVTPADDEVAVNPRSRSARLRLLRRRAAQEAGA